MKKKFTELCELNLSKTAATFLTYKFILLLKKSFTDWEAYKLGLINEKGEKIKEPKTKEEKDSLGGMNNLIRKIKRLVGKFIPNEKLLNFLVTVYLLREDIQNKTYNDLACRLQEYLSPEENDFILNILQEHREEID